MGFCPNNVTEVQLAWWNYHLKSAVLFARKLSGLFLAYFHNLFLPMQHTLCLQFWYVDMVFFYDRLWHEDKFFVVDF